MTGLTVPTKRCSQALLSAPWYPQPSGRALTCQKCVIRIQLLSVIPFPVLDASQNPGPRRVLAPPHEPPSNPPQRTVLMAPWCVFVPSMK